jgi:hypothetical protein
MTEEPGFSFWRRDIFISKAYKLYGAYPDFFSLDNWGCFSGG